MQKLRPIFGGRAVQLSPEELSKPRERHGGTLTHCLGLSDPSNPTTIERLGMENDNVKRPLILIGGLPFTGKSAVARELGRLLEEQEEKLRQKRQDPDVTEDRLAVLKRRRACQKGEPGPSGYKRLQTLRSSGAVEQFADGRVVIVHMNEFCDTVQYKQTNGNAKSSSHSTGNNEQAHRSLSAAHFTASLGMLAQARSVFVDPGSAAQLEAARRQALEAHVFPELTAGNVVIITECLLDHVNGRFAADAYKAAANVCGRRLIPVYLACDPKDHEKRLACRARDDGVVVDSSESNNTTESTLTSEELQELSSVLTAPTAGDAGPDQGLYYFSPVVETDSPSAISGQPASPRRQNGLSTTSGPAAEQASRKPAGRFLGCHIDSTGLSARDTATLIRDFVQDLQHGVACMDLRDWEVDPDSIEAGWSVVGTQMQ